MAQALNNYGFATLMNGIPTYLNDVQGLPLDKVCSLKYIFLCKRLRESRLSFAIPVNIQFMTSFPPSEWYCHLLAIRVLGSHGPAGRLPLGQVDQFRKSLRQQHEENISMYR